MNRVHAFAGAVVAGFVLIAAARPASRIPLFDAVTKCRSISDNVARLECFDRSVGALDDAAAKNDVVVVDREQVRKTKRTLFGLSLPSFDLFASQEDKAEELSQITGTVGSAERDGQGRLIVTLADGAHWHQTDDSAVGRTPRAGDTVTIKRAAFNSYMMRVGPIAMRVRREN